MAVEAVWGGDHANGRPYDRRRDGKRAPSAANPSSEGFDDEERVVHALVQDPVRLVVDDNHHVLLVEIVDARTDDVIRSIPSDQLASHDYHGILVDVQT